MNTFEKIFKVPVLSMGFRPFFIMVIFAAIIPSSMWIIQFTGIYSFDFSPLTANQWHANEMIFGFVLAAVIGFLLTASANWTGTRGINGQGLFVLFALFFITRMLFWFLPFENLWMYACSSLIVPCLIVVHLAKLFIKTNNRRNLMLIIPLSVFTVGQLLVLSSNYMLGYELSLYSVRFLIVVIAGRVIPFFTRRAIGMEPKWDQPILEKLTILSVLLLIFEPLFKTSSVVGEYIWIGLTFIALVLNTFRLVNWRFIPAFKVKILFILYVAYLWLPIHFALSFANYFQWVDGNGKGILHALSYGCMGVMILGIIHRVTLGHTGRVIKAGLIPIMAYAFLSLGSLIRVFVPILDPTNYILWIQASGIMWALSFVFIGFEIIPMLISSRVDGKEY